MNRTDLIEALIFAAERPVATEKLAQIAEISVEDVARELEALREEKVGVGALQLVEVAGGWQFVTKAAFAPHIRKLQGEKRGKLSRAAFEVLAIVAYRQPVTRGEIESLRGVECAGPLGILLERKLLAPAGRREVAGRPWLYKTTPHFLEQFGLKSLDDLPELEELAALENATPPELFARGAA